jgi:hypothetical protein
VIRAEWVLVKTFQTKSASCIWIMRPKEELLETIFQFFPNVFVAGEV